MISTKTLLATAVAVGFAGTASAAIVQNPNFAPTDPTGFTIQNWTPTVVNTDPLNPLTGSAVNPNGNNPTATLNTTQWTFGSVPDGQHGASGLDNTVGFETVSSGTPVGLSQTLSLTIGQAYTLSFYANADLFGGSVIATALVGGTSIFSATVGANDPFTLETATFIATSSSEVLTLSASEAAGNPATLLLAGVTVTPVATPEPASLALLGAGLAATGLIRRRRA